MKTNIFKISFIVFLLISSNVFSQVANNDVKVKELNFTVPARGEKIYEINVPVGAKKIKAVISNQSEMVSMEIIGTTGTILCKNSSRSNLSNRTAPVTCSASVVKNDRQKPGIWKIKVKGAVHKNDAERIKTVSGKLEIVITK